MFVCQRKAIYLDETSTINALVQQAFTSRCEHTSTHLGKHVNKAATVRAVNVTERTL